MKNQSNSGVRSYNLTDEIVRGVVPMNVDEDTTPGKALLLVRDTAASLTCTFMDGSTITIPVSAGLTLLPFAARKVNISGAYVVC